MLELSMFYKIKSIWVTLLLFLSLTHQSPAIPLEETDEKSKKTGSQALILLDHVPLICGNLEQNKMIECRRVCRGWNKQILPLIKIVTLSAGCRGADDLFSQCTNLEIVNLKNNTKLTSETLTKLKNRGVTILKIQKKQDKSPQEFYDGLGVLAMYFPW